MGEMVELSQMLEARDRRVQRQDALLERYRLPVVSFTMNIAGPVKNSPLIRRGFQMGRELLMGQLSLVRAPVRFSEEVDAFTGCEGLYVVDAAPSALKAIACDIEDHTPLGRPFGLILPSASESAMIPRLGRLLKPLLPYAGRASWRRVPC